MERYRLWLLLMLLVEVWMFLMSVSVVIKISLLIKPLLPSGLRLGLISPFHATSLHVFLPHIFISYTIPYPVRYHGLERTRNETKGPHNATALRFRRYGFCNSYLGAQLTLSACSQLANGG